MGLSAPFFLLLLVALPMFVWLGWPSRGPSRRRELISLALRLLMALGLILGLAGLEIRRQSESLSVVFLVDDSDSMRVPIAAGNVTATPRLLALEYVRQALKAMGPNDKAGLILFGGDAVVERPLSSSRELEGITSKVTSIQTNLAGAIRLGLALLPSDTARRMVILSDGAETSGDAFEAARLARANGTQIVVVPFGITAGAEALLTAVNAPTRLRQGEQFALEINVSSTADQQVGVRVLAGSAVAYEGALQLRRGQNAFSLPLEAGLPGFAAYRVQLVPLNGADTFYQNNELAAFSQISGPPRVLMVTNPAPRDGVEGYRELLAALQASGLQVQTALPRDLPAELPALSEYASVILVDVPARALSPRQMAAIETYVRDLGGGLVAVGGPTSYGLGGYYKTPLEAVLPVEMQIKDEKRFPKVSMVVVMDKSGSMSAQEGGVTKMQLADEGAARVAELMHDFDELTIVAFDTSPVDVIGPISGVDREQAAARARTIGPGGGGILVLEALQYAAGVIRQSPNATRHIILLADGSDAENQNGARELVRELAAEGVTLSVVSLGRGPDTPFLEDIAVLGNGRFHMTENAASIPEIFTSETTEIQRNYIIEETFFPKQNAPSPILAGINSVPSLQGYVGTTARDTATTILISDLASGYQDPILAVWQYGLGHSVAWTSDATGRWAKNWVSWEQFARFWAQAVRYTLSEGAPANTDVQVQHQSGQATIAVDAQSDSGAYLNGLSVQANVIGPDGTTQTLTLPQTAPGRYSGNFTPLAQGAYLIRVTGTEAGQPAGSPAAIAQTAGWVLSYSPEYQVDVRAEEATEAVPTGARLLFQIAQLTGGSSVTGDYAAVFAHDLAAPPSAAQPVWPWLLLAATLLLPFDIAVRRLVISRHDLQRAWQRLRAWAHLGQPQAIPATPQRAEQLSSLFKAKDRAGTASKPVDGDALAVTPPPIVTRPAEPPKPAATPVTPGAPSPTSSSTSSALLAKKRAREKKD